VSVQPAPLVERELELETVERLLAGARARSGGAVVFEGPAGIGKSSLLAAAQSAAAADLRVLSARGGELERELPFGIVRQLLESAVVSSDAEEREALLAGAAALARPVLFAADPEAGAEPSFSALHGLYWLTINLADTEPLLVAVDDAHWADIASLRWLIYLARRLAGVPLALVLATRPAEAGPVQELLDELLVIPEVAVLQPGGLSERAIALLAAQLLSAEPDPSFVTACRRATGGNPFLLLELLGELGRRGIAPSRENADLASQLSSQGVGRAVRARLRRLPPGCPALARAVAVLGDLAEPNLAAQLAGLDDDAVSSAADALAEVVIFEPGRLAFVHPLVRSSVYSELSSHERARHHERAARLLAGAGEAPDRIAVHLLATHPSGDAERVHTLRQAANGASKRGAHDIAVTYLRRALAEPPSPALEAEVVYELGKAALSAGELELAIERLRRQLGSLPMWACARRRRTRSGRRSSSRTGPRRRSASSRRSSTSCQRASASWGCGCRRRAGWPPGAAWQSGVVSRQEGSGSSSPPVRLRRLGRACRSLSPLSTPLGRGQPRRPAGWPCARSPVGGCSKIQPRR